MKEQRYVDRTMNQKQSPGEQKQYISTDPNAVRQPAADDWSPATETEKNKAGSSTGVQRPSEPNGQIDSDPVADRVRHQEPRVPGDSDGPDLI